MFVKKIIKIENYRNLSGLEFSFNEEINFIVGENNIGKTNVIELLNSVINKCKFDEKDFCDIKTPIKIIFEIQYNDNELGFFENKFDVDDEYTITITAFQSSVDDRIEYCHTESETYISPKNIKMLNFLYYSSLRTPNKEINFIKNLGTGKVLNYLMKKSLEYKEIEEIDLLNMKDMDEVLKEVNKKIKKLNGLSNENIQAYISNNKENIINRILEIGDSNGRCLGNLGDGVQYSFNIFLTILELLVRLKTTKKDEEYQKILIKDEGGEKYLPIVIAFDEPEIHQHPYRQRALIKGIKKIIDNKNKDFLEIVKDLFDIDGFIGQVFIVTHSPNILLNDYKQVIRLYKSKDKLETKCGTSIDFKSDIHKHLMRSFIYFKEAMFSKQIILVEGDTEYGAVPVFAKRMEYDMDQHNVGVVKLDGADSILKCMRLYKEFNIDAIAIIDRDKKDKYCCEKNVYFTNEIDFEKEIFKLFSLEQYMKYLNEINKIAFLNTKLKARLDDFNPEEFNNNPLKYPIPNKIARIIMNEIEENELKELRNGKNVINGAILAKYVDAIPESFKNVIKKAILGV